MPFLPEPRPVLLGFAAVLVSSGVNKMTSCRSRCGFRATRPGPAGTLVYGPVRVINFTARSCDWPRNDAQDIVAETFDFELLRHAPSQILDLGARNYRPLTTGRPMHVGLSSCRIGCAWQLHSPLYPNLSIGEAYRLFRYPSGI